MSTRFNLRREAAPHATPGGVQAVPVSWCVSISDEKPLHMRPGAAAPARDEWRRFNLRREAAPHATMW